MKRIMILATVVAFALTVAGFAQSALQTFPRGSSYRRIQVNPNTIKALVPGKKLVVDLTQRGVIYEFNPQGRQLDFSRLTIRTIEGELTFGSLLERTVPTDKLSRFGLSSQSFIVGTRATGTLQPPSRDTTDFDNKLSFQCGSISCQCTGEADCSKLILKSGRCGTYYFCYVDREDGEIHCYCRQQQVGI